MDPQNLIILFAAHPFVGDFNARRRPPIHSLFLPPHPLYLTLSFSFSLIQPSPTTKISSYLFPRDIRTFPFGHTFLHTPPFPTIGYPIFPSNPQKIISL